MTTLISLLKADAIRARRRFNSEHYVSDFCWEAFFDYLDELNEEQLFELVDELEEESINQARARAGE